MSRPRLCWEWGDNPTEWPVRLIQLGTGRFRVEYGAEVHEPLDYAEAARRIGGAVMHALACGGRIRP